MGETAWLLAYVGAAVLAVAAGDLAGSRFCALLRRRCGDGPLLRLPAWIRVGIGVTIPVIGFSGVILAAIGIYGSRAFWVLTHNPEMLSLVAFFITGMLTSIYVGGFCSEG